MFLYDTTDEAVDDPKKGSKVQCFNFMLDKVIQSLESRFQQLKSHVKLFGFLNNFQSLQKAEIRKCTVDLEAALTETILKHSTNGGVVTETTKDMHGYLLAEELEALKTFLPFSAVKPQSQLEYLAANNQFTAILMHLLL